MNYDAIRTSIRNANPDGLDGCRYHIWRCFERRGGRMTHRQWIQDTALMKKAAVAKLKLELTRSTKRHVFLKEDSQQKETFDARSR